MVGDYLSVTMSGAEICRPLKFTNFFFRTFGRNADYMVLRQLLVPPIELDSICGDRSISLMAAEKWLLLLLSLFLTAAAQEGSETRTVIDVAGGPDSVVWAVQLSDLHFSVFQPDRALDFRRIIGPSLSMINPSLVLITGDLTDGKSKDLLTMKQEEAEWLEYQNVLEDVIKRSRLNKNIFYDLRGNHDCFGVPESGGVYDFYSKHSINARLRRDGNVHSVTLQIGGWRHLFVGFDSTMEIGLRGPTNLFGHPTDKLLADLDGELSQWSAESTKSPVTKITFGHFPLSFTAASDTGKNLKDIFLKHSISAYLCGHLHTKFGKNLKRHHQSGRHSPISGRYYQYNIHEGTQIGADGENCSNEYEPTSEFWEWEMGDWRQSRAMRILAIDSGHVSYLDVDFKMGLKKTIIMPTFPIDSRFMQRASSPHYFKCQTTKASSYDTVRVLIFSRTVIASVTVKIYDSRPGNLNLVLDSPMKKLEGNETRGDLYTVPWNWRAFVDPSPDRYWLQIEAIDISGTSSYSKKIPFSINGLTARVSWKWKEFFVMGCQWTSLYHPILWSSLFCIFTLLLIPHALHICSKRQYTYKNISPSFNGRKVVECLVDGTFWVLTELSKMTVIWWSVLLYIIYLIFFPWFSGHVFTESGKVAYMTYEGWAVARSNGSGKSVVGVPDVMVVVLPHICFVVLPTLLVVAVLAAEKTAYRIHYLSLSGKKEDDQNKEIKRHVKHAIFSIERFWSGRLLRKFVLLLCLAIFWKHWKQCRALVKAYEMNPFLDSPIFCFWTPMLLVYAIYQTGTV